MASIKSKKLTTAAADRELLGIDRAGQQIGPIASSEPGPPQAASSGVFPIVWQWHWLLDGRVAVIEQLSNGWRIIIERSTEAVLISRAEAIEFLTRKQAE